MTGQFWEITRRHAGLLLLVAAAPLIVTYPLALHASNSMFAPGDNFITMWTTLWQVHALSTPGEHFWDANIFYPYPRTAALSVLRIIYVPFAASILWLTHNPVLMENLIQLGSIILSGVGMYIYCYWLTRHRLAAALAGILFTCCPERFGRLPHPHQVSPIFFAPALLSLSLFLKKHQNRYAVLAAFCLFLQFLTSIYLFVFTAVALAALIASDLDLWRWEYRRVVSVGGMLLIIILLVIAPFAAPYLINHFTYQFKDAFEWTVDLSARPGDYFVARSMNLLDGWTESAFGVPRFITGMIPPEFLLPGFAALTLFAFGIYLLFRQDNIHKRTLRFGVILAAVGFVLSLGPYLHIGTEPTRIPLPALLLYKFIPGFSVIRAPARFSILVTAGVAIAAAGAVAYWMESEKRWKRLLINALSIIACLECLNKPLVLQAIPIGKGIPKVEQWLAQRPERVVVSYPLRYHLSYMYFSYWHWKRLINGWTGYMANDFMKDESALNLLPSPESIETLKRRGAELIVIYRRFDTDPPFITFLPEENEGVQYYISELKKRPELFELVYDDGAAAAFRFLGGKEVSP
ncbi:MAG: hypothetical protein AB1656_17970 [Candidatus Omnitrophota bacterium]